MKTKEESLARARGLFNIAITPFADDGRIDLAGFTQNLEPMLELGYDGLLTGGTYGESPAMDTPEGVSIETDADLARYLLHDAGVAVVPGTAFGMASYLRLAHAVPGSRLQEACERIVAACLRLA